MATSYSALKTEIADFYERTDLTAQIDTFIDLCESEMQRALKLTAFEATAAITVTAGVGALPTGFSSARALSWASSPNRTLRYITPDELARVNISEPSTVDFYTIVGSQIKTADDSDGTLNITYTAGFTPLSDSAPTNTILTNHPGAYLYGSTMHAAIYCKDFDGGVAYKALFEAELEKIRRDDNQKKYIGPLAVRLA